MNASIEQMAKSLSAEEALTTAVHFIDIARTLSRRAPSRISDELTGLREEVDGIRANFKDELWQAIDENGSWCIDCPYCLREGDGYHSEKLRECDGDSSVCPGVQDILE